MNYELYLKISYKVKSTKCNQERKKTERIIYLRK